MQNLTNVIAEHMIIAALWADAPESTNPRATKAAQAQAERYAARFTANIADLLPVIAECPEYWAHPDCYGAMGAAIGHDLYLTVQGHGVGFWDRDTLPEKLRKELTRRARGKCHTWKRNFIGAGSICAPANRARRVLVRSPQNTDFRG